MYLTRLFELFSGWSDCPIAASSDDLMAHFDAGLRSITSVSRRASSVKALLSFFRYVDTIRAEPLDFDPDEYPSGGTAGGNIVLPAAFARMQELLLGAGETDLADMAMLMFRAGLRENEVQGLQVGDVNIAGDRIELTVQRNASRALKTPTSRRIVPLDVLIDDEERARLMYRVAPRRAKSAPGREAWLFGPALAVSPPCEFVSKLQPVLAREATALRHLRHSFASYLLATLLLPQDDRSPAVPSGLATVISPERYRLVGDRLLGQQRLGAGALHAVAQLMGHTGPRMTCQYYCRLLDLSLALYCARPATMIPVDVEATIATLAIHSDSQRRAGGRAMAGIEDGSPKILPTMAERPDAATILRYTPDVKQRLADASVVQAGVHRRGVRLARRLTAQMVDIELPQRRAAAKARREEQKSVGKAKPKPCQPVDHYVPWRGVIAHVEAIGTLRPDMTREDQQIARLSEIEAIRKGLPDGDLQSFVDQRLRLSRKPRRAEIAALVEVVRRFRQGHTDIRLARLQDAEAFVRLLGIMGFARSEIQLAHTGWAGKILTSDRLHAFLADRSTAPGLSGRWGGGGHLWFGSSP